MRVIDLIAELNRFVYQGKIDPYAEVVICKQDLGIELTVRNENLASLYDIAVSDTGLLCLLPPEDENH